MWALFEQLRSSYSQSAPESDDKWDKSFGEKFEKMLQIVMYTHSEKVIQYLVRPLEHLYFWPQAVEKLLC